MATIVRFVEFWGETAARGARHAGAPAGGTSHSTGGRPSPPRNELVTTTTPMRDGVSYRTGHPSGGSTGIVNPSVGVLVGMIHVA